MNRYSLFAILCFLVALFIGVWGMGSSFLLGHKAARVEVSEQPVMAFSMQEPVPPPPPAPQESRPDGLRSIQRSRQKTTAQYEALIKALGSEVTELRADNQTLKDRVVYLENVNQMLMKEIRSNSGQEDTPKKLLTYAGTSVSAIGGIFSIILGVRKERRESKRKKEDDNV